MFNFKSLIIVLLYFLFLIPTSKGQHYTCQLTGNFKKITVGKVYLIPAISDLKYYNKNTKIDSANIYDGKFVINRKLYDSDIYPYRIVVKSDSFNGTTNLVFLSAGIFTATIDSISEYISPIINKSPIQNEMRYSYDKYFEELVFERQDFMSYLIKMNEKYSGDLPEKETKEIRARSEDIINRGDSLFIEYAKRNTDSYVTLWKLIERFKNLGYKKEYLDIYNQLTNHIKNTTGASHLFHDLQNAKVLALGSIFPDLQLKTQSQQRVDVKFINHNSRFTLVDFWFSGCIPCLREFPDLKILHNKYKNKEFNIIGISIDKKSEINNWKKVIKKDNLNWIHYLDEDGILSKELAINSFPSNFLLNNEGKIIRKDISIEDLQTYLGSNLRISDNIRYSYEPF